MRALCHPKLYRHASVEEKVDTGSVTSFRCQSDMKVVMTANLRRVNALLPVCG